MSYLVLKSCFAGGERRNVGEIIDIEGAEANNLLAWGRVEVCAAPAKQEPTNRAVDLETSDVAPVKKRGRKSNGSAS